MIFAQFYQNSTGYIAGTIPPQFGKPELIEACGDRAVIILDGRVSPKTKGEIAAAECKKRGYIAWRIFKGDTFTRCAAISGVWYVHSDKPVPNPAWLSAHGM